MNSTIVSMDMVYLIHDAGIPVHFRHEKKDVLALVDWDITDSPGYGYTGKLSGRCHDVTFVVGDFSSVPVRGDMVIIENEEFQVLFSYPVHSEVYGRVSIGKVVTPQTSTETTYF